MLGAFKPKENLKNLKDAPLEDHPLAARREPPALEECILEVRYCDPKESRAFLRILCTEGRGAKGPKRT